MLGLPENLMKDGLKSKVLQKFLFGKIDLCLCSNRKTLDFVKKLEQKI